MKASLLRNGMMLDWNGSVVQVIEFQHLPNGMTNINAKNLLTKQMVALQVHTSDELRQIYLEKKKVSYSFEEGGKYYFLDEETFDEIVVAKNEAPKYFEYVAGGTDCFLEMYRGKIYNITYPMNSVMTVASVKNGIATLKNGAEIKVQGFVKAGDQIAINVLTGEFTGVW